MSLSSFLLTGSTAKSSAKGKQKAIDAELDAIFKTSFAPVQTSLAPSNAAKSLATAYFQPPESFLAPLSTDHSKRRQRNSEESAGLSEPSAKKIKTLNKKPSTASSLPDATSTSIGKPVLTAMKAKTKRSEPTVKPACAENVPSLDSTHNANVEDAYASGRQCLREVRDDRNDKESDGEMSHDSESDEGSFDPSKLVHETVTKGTSTTTGSSKGKYVPPEETSEQRDARTIFIGNIPMAVMKSRPMQKQLKRHILGSTPSAKIESVRFRSVAFQRPTAKLPTSEDDTIETSHLKSKESRFKKERDHNRERAAHWRQAQDAKEDAEVKKDEKKFLTAAEKKKIAFIKGELHAVADSANAYLMFAHARPGVVPEGQQSVMHPYDAARLAVEKCDGTVFMERTIRVDHVGKKPTGAGERGTGALAGDPKCTLFVGNLDFASKEEDLRAFFEGLVTTERGLPPASTEAESDDEVITETVKRSAWVRRVRIVRDKETQLGKGFAYVWFADRECVDEILAMPQDKVKFAKRKLRVQRCKTLPGGASAPRNPKAADTAKLPKHKQSNAQTMSTPVVVPKGDPSLGAKLASLSKEDRKAAKATDTDRVARRMAKKQAKLAAAKSARGLAEDKARIRKRPGAKKGPGAAQKETKKRALSERSVAKRNIKK